MQTQLLINGRFVAGEGARRDHRQSGDRRADRGRARGVAVAGRGGRGRRRCRVPEMGAHHAAGAVAEAAAGRRPDRAAGGGVRRAGVAQHRQAAGPGAGRRAAGDRRLLPLLRRGGALRAGGRGRRVPAGPDQHDPARPGRRRGPGRALELPADDGGLEAGAGAGGRQHRGAEAVRADAADHAQARRDPGRDLSVGRGQHRGRPRRHGGRTAGQPRPRAHGLAHRQPRGRHQGPGGGRAPRPSAPIWSSAARRR